jgi:DNA polymerase III epsilon subunit-like protein
MPRQDVPHVIFFDLETTGFDKPIQPVQIGAIDSWGQAEYNQFLLPNRRIHPLATRTNGFTTDKHMSRLYRNEEELETVELEEGLNYFMDWLRSLGGTVILVAHKCHNYDGKVLLYNLKEFNIKYEDVISGFSDSLIASRVLYPHLESRRLPDMMQEVGLGWRESHDALLDAYDCRSVVRRVAAQQRIKFMNFVIDPQWYKTTAQQKAWTFNRPPQVAVHPKAGHSAGRIPQEPDYVGIIHGLQEMHV